MRLNLERARHFTASMRSTGHLPLVMRWALALSRVMERIPVHILPDEIIVGRGAGPGLYGLFYPELEGAYFSAPEQQTFEGQRLFSPEDVQVLTEELAPYWSGQTYHDGLLALFPEDLRQLFFQRGDGNTPSCICNQSATLRHSLQWCLDYGKVFKRGFRGIEEEAEERLRALDGSGLEIGVREERRSFYLAVITLCQGVRVFAERHADLAARMALAEGNPVRREELNAIARRCRQVPYHPALTFAEAVQALWFTQLVSRLEQIHGGGAVGAGRIDQYLYPYYVADLREGRLTREQALDYLDALWANMAQCLCLQPNPSGLKVPQEHSHWECVTIGGQTADGHDAVNELSWLVLESAARFPGDYPYLAVRVHAGLDEAFLRSACELVKQGKGVPVLLNDEEIIPLLRTKGGTLEEARDYCGSGYSEARLINRHTYFTGTTWVSLAAALDLVLWDGRTTPDGPLLGPSTGNPDRLASFDDLMAAFEVQLDHLVLQVFRQQAIADAIRPRHLAAPLVSCLHDVCMRHGRDINTGPFEGDGIHMGGVVGVAGFATVVDALAAIRHLVFQTRLLDLSTLRRALAANFEGYEVIRRHCQNAPKYGNGDPEVDAIGLRIDAFLISLCEQHGANSRGVPEIFYIPASGYTAMGRETGASANGRLAGEPLSRALSPSQGSNRRGPCVTLNSVRATRSGESASRASRAVVLELTPQSVAGEVGTEALVLLVRSWCRQRHWFLRIHMTNENDVVSMRNDPEKYRHLLVRKPGFNTARLQLSPPRLREVMLRGS